MKQSIHFNIFTSSICSINHLSLYFCCTYIWLCILNVEYHNAIQAHYKHLSVSSRNILLMEITLIIKPLLIQGRNTISAAVLYSDILSLEMNRFCHHHLSHAKFNIMYQFLHALHEKSWSWATKYNL